MSEVLVVGSDLAVSKAAYQLDKRGISVLLYNMHHYKITSAYKIDLFEELAYSNSFQSVELTKAVSFLKENLKLLCFLIMEGAIF
ncbi:MAG: FAD-dependent oxidoreductase [Caldimicrobium sp.]